MKKLQAGELVYHVAEPDLKTGKTVFLYHGWGGTVNSWSIYAGKLAQQGHYVVVPEIIYNDTRKPVKNPFEMETVQTYFWKAVLESIEEFTELKEALCVPDADMVLVGSSMGGFIASGIFASQPQAAGLASINGSGAFILTEKIFRERQDRSPLPEEATALLKRFDPLEQDPGQGAVLLINGELDRTVPLEGHEVYFRHLKETHRHQNSKQKIYKGIGHQFTSEMEQEVTSWLAQI